MATSNELLSHLLDLPAPERASIARTLLDSLDDDEDDEAAYVLTQEEEVALAEALAEADQGGGIPVEQFLARLHARR